MQNTVAVMSKNRAITVIVMRFEGSRRGRGALDEDYKNQENGD